MVACGPSVSSGEAHLLSLSISGSETSRRPSAKVDVFALYSITLVGGRHVMLPSFTAQEALLAMGEFARYLQEAVRFPAITFSA